MRYQVQWFPKGNAKYNEILLLKAAQDQPLAQNVMLVPNVNRYNPSAKVIYPNAVEFTVTGGYDSGNLKAVLIGMNKYLMAKFKTQEPQNLSFRTISLAERKKRGKASIVVMKRTMMKVSETRIPLKKTKTPPLKITMKKNDGPKTSYAYGSYEITEEPIERKPRKKSYKIKRKSCKCKG